MGRGGSEVRDANRRLREGKERAKGMPGLVTYLRERNRKIRSSRSVYRRPCLKEDEREGVGWREGGEQV